MTCRTLAMKESLIIQESLFVGHLHYSTTFIYAYWYVFFPCSFHPRKHFTLIFDIKQVWFHLIFQLTEICFPAWVGDGKRQIRHFHHGSSYTLSWLSQELMLSLFDWWHAWFRIETLPHFTYHFRVLHLTDWSDIYHRGLLSAPPLHYPCKTLIHTLYPMILTTIMIFWKFDFPAFT